MTDRAVQAQEYAVRLEASIPRLRKEIADRRANMAAAKARALASPSKGRLATGWFAAWSRHAPPIAKAEAQLTRALKRLPRAKERATDIAISQRKANTKKARLRAATAAIERRLDALKETAAAVDQRWRKERRDEPRNIKKLTKKIRDRTKKDHQAPAEWRRRPATLPPPIEQPQPEAVAVMVTPSLPDRPDLIPGTYTVMDPARLMPLLDEDPLPPRWTWRHVGSRLLRAFDTLRALPEKDKPKHFASMWPSYRIDAGDLAGQVVQGTHSTGIGRRSVSAIDVELMEDAIDWPLQFLSNVPEFEKKWLLFWLNDPDSELDSETTPKEYFEAIATALNAAHEVVR
jgi:hypothetical protein